MNRPRQLSSVARSGPASPGAGTEETSSTALERCIGLVGGSEAMAAVRAQLRRVSAHFRVVLITGEAGTGKEIVARTMHSLSAPPERPFVSHSAAAFLPLMPELLAGAGDAGMVEGAVSRTFEGNGARTSTAVSGVISARGSAGPERSGATLFLGDVNALTCGEQAYLLEALTRLEVLRNRGERPRLIFATERDLRALAGAGQFDAKLYRKISAVEVTLPPLRSRREDIAMILLELLQAENRPPRGMAAQSVDGRALARLEEYGWPGNVRELKRVIELGQMHAGGGVIELMHLPPLGGPGDAMQQGGDVVERLEDVIQSHVLEVLLRCSGNKVRAAGRLGISRSTLYRTLENSAAAVLERVG
jgi:DNA-binding NtrC family response regulator